MKKIISFLIFISAFVAFTKAQTTGSWIYTDNGKYPFLGTIHTAPKSSSIPRSFMVNNSRKDMYWKPNDTLFKVMSSILDIYKQAYPKPVNHSVLINAGDQRINTDASQKELDKRYWAHISLGNWGFEFKNNKLLPFRLFPNGSPTDGYGHCYINYFPIAYGVQRSWDHNTRSNDHLDAFKVMTLLSYKDTTNAKGNDELKVRSTGRIYSIPPKFSFHPLLAGRYDIQNILKQYKNEIAIPNFSANQHLFQRLMVANGDYKRGEEFSVENFAILTYNGKQPYKPVSIGIVLNILDTIILEKKARLIEYYNTVTKKSDDYLKYKKNYDDNLQKNLADLDIDKDALEAIRAYYKYKINNPAIISTALDHLRNAFVGGSFYLFRKDYSVLNPELARKNIARLFTDNPNEGYSLVQIEKDFQRQPGSNYVKIITIIWKEYFYPKGNSNNGNCVGTTNTDSDGISTPYVPYSGDCNQSFSYAMRHIFDWGKLEALFK